MSAITSMMDLRRKSQWEGLKEAVRNGAVTAICRWFDETRGVNSSLNEELMDLLLALAIDHRHTNVVKLLIHHGADVNGKHHDVYHLHRAVIRGYDDVIKMLVSNGANVASHNEVTGKTALHLAAANCGLTSGEDIISLLIESNGKNTQIDSHLCAHSQRKRKLNLCGDSNDKENIPISTTTTFARRQHTKAVTNTSNGEGTRKSLSGSNRNVLLRHSEGLSLSEYLQVKDKVQGNTALHVACAYNNTLAALCLLRHGAEPNTLNLHGDTPLAKLLRPVTRCQNDGHNQSRLTLARRLVALGLVVVCDGAEQPITAERTHQYKNIKTMPSCVTRDTSVENTKSDQNDPIEVNAEPNLESTNKCMALSTKSTAEVTTTPPTDNMEQSSYQPILVSHRTPKLGDGKTGLEISKHSLCDNVDDKTGRLSDKTNSLENYEEMFDRLLDPLSEYETSANSPNGQHFFGKHSILRHTNEPNTQPGLANCRRDKSFREKRKFSYNRYHLNPEGFTSEAQKCHKQNLDSTNFSKTLHERIDPVENKNIPKREHFTRASVGLTVSAKPPRPRHVRVQTCETGKYSQHSAMETSSVSLRKGDTTPAQETKTSEQNAGTREYVRSRSRHTSSCDDTMHVEQQCPLSTLSPKVHITDIASMSREVSCNAARLAPLRDASGRLSKDLPRFRFPNKDDRIRARYKRLSRDVSTTLNLQQLCRLVILRSLVGQSVSGNVSKLGLPVPMQRFLLYEGLF